MPTLAVAMIVKNEAKHLDACLKSVADWVDEIVILDSGSSDATQQIAESYQAKFYENTQWPGFGEQRRLAQQYVTADFVLWLDADERVTPELKLSIQRAVTANKSNTLYTFCRLSWVFGRYIRHCGWYPDRVVRLYPTRLTQYNSNLVHESVEVDKNTMQVENLKGDLLHYTYEDLHHYLVKSASYAKASAIQRQQSGKKGSLFAGLVSGLSCFIKMYIVKLGFLDGKQGFLISILSAHSSFIKYADLWIRTKTEPPKD